jgi:hypothetical protein
MRHVFYRQIFAGAENNNGFPIAALETTPLLPATDLATTPLGSGNTDADDWSARWYGQFYAAVPGQYELRANTDDGNQIRIAGALGGSDWTRGSGNGSAVGTASASLAVGWHDVVFDYNSVGGARAAQVHITMAPDASLVGAPIPRERLRPVEPRRDRLISETRKFGAVSIPNGSPGPIRTITFEGFPNEIVTALDITFGLSTNDLGQLQFRAQRPGGASTVVANPSGNTQINNGHFYVHVTDPAVIGQAVGGTWSFQVSDNTGSSNTSSLDELLVTIHTTGGPPAIADTSSWISPVRDVGAAPVEVTSVTWVERAAIPSELFMRACASADCSDDPPWGAAIPNAGSATLDTQYIQAKVVMHSDGTTEPELDSLTINYRR